MCSFLRLNANESDYIGQREFIFDKSEIFFNISCSILMNTIDDAIYFPEVFDSQNLAGFSKPN